jgi:4-amino-4-deoxy-L-arabinose transferase-like glycosyltransferase
MNRQNNSNQQPSTLTTALHILTTLAVALGIRAYLWLKVPHVIMLNEADGMGYISIARNIVENFSISNSIHFPPFYPALIAISSLIVGNYESGARFTSIVAGSCMVVPFYLGCRYLMPARAAFCAALFAAFFGTFVDYDLQPLSQATYTGLIATGVWLGLRYIKIPSRISLAGFAMTSAAIYLTRPEGILFYVANLPIMMYVVYSTEKDLKERLKSWAVLLISFIVPFILYVFSLKRYTGYWSISGKSGVTSIGIDASMKLLPGGKTYGETMAGSAGLSSLIPSFSGFMKTYLTQLGKFTTLVYSTLPHSMLIIALIGIVVIAFNMFRQERSGRMRAVCRNWIFLSPLAMILPVMAFDKIAVTTGYILPFFMVVFGCCAMGLVWLEVMITEWIGKLFLLPENLRRQIPLAVLASALFSAFMLIPFYQSISSDEFRFLSAQQDFLLRQTGHWVGSKTDKKAIIMARWSNIGYYGNRDWTGLVDGSVDEVTEYARRHGVTHIVIDSDAVPRRRPKLASLLDPASTHPGLIPVYVDQQFNTRVVVYQVH